MGTLDELRSRRSCRAYTDEPVSPEDERALISAAFEAPTPGNQQLYTVIVARDQALKERLAILCDNQPFVARAGLVLVFVADLARWHDAYLAAGADPREPGPGDALLAVEDAAIAAQNAVVAAEALGLGSCYIGDIMENYEQLVELLQLPDYAFPAVMVVFGHPTAGHANRVKPQRFTYDDLVCEDVYRPIDDARRDEAFAPKRRGDVDPSEWMRAFCARKWDSDFSREMSRSVAAWLSRLDFGTDGDVSADGR